MLFEFQKALGKGAGTVAFIARFILAFQPAEAAPPPAPIGFLWEERGITLNPDNGTYALPSIDLNYTDTSRSNGVPDLASVNLSRSFMTVPGATGTGTNVGDLYYEAADNSISFEFGVNGVYDGSARPRRRQFDVSGTVSAEVAGRVENISLYTTSFTNSFSAPVDDRAVLSTSGLTDGSDITLDLTGLVSIESVTGAGRGSAEGDVTVSGRYTLTQSYRTFELVLDNTAIPEPSSAMFLLVGAGLLGFRRGRRRS